VRGGFVTLLTTFWGFRVFKQRWLKWLGKSFTWQTHPNGRQRHALGLRPQIEPLEERCTPTQITLTSAHDNTLYEETSQSSQLSNGAGQHFYVGDTNQSSSIYIRRGVLEFDLSAVPAGSTITGATLTLHMSKTAAGAGAQNIALHLLQQAWGEGTSNAGNGGAGSGEGDGVTPTTNDATWLDTFYSSSNPQLWTTAGGTFSSIASATTSVNAVGFYSWSGSQLTADVQSWVNQPSTNFGWIAIGNETTNKTAKQFDTRENTTSADRPSLVVTYTAPPTVTSVSPSSGPAAGGTSVIITGTGFTGATAVDFGGAAATSFMVNSDTQITAVDPAGTGVVDVTVTIPVGGTSATSTADQFTYVAAPTVTSLNPTTGPAAGGTSVIITGTGFTGATAVQFGGAAATSFMVNSDTQITAVDPAGTGAVDVTVTIPVGGTSSTSSADLFTYNASTTTSVTSNPVGPITQGDSVDFTATISNANPGNVGTVSFYFDYGQPDQFQIGGAVSVNNGSATSDATTALPSGSDTITAIYSGGAGFDGSQGTYKLVVNQTTTTTVTSNPPGPITQGDSVDFTAAITGNPNVGTVSFYFDYGQPDQFQIGGAVSVNSGSATSDATTALPAGSDTITAIYSGGTGFAGSQGTDTLLVNQTTTTTVTSNPVGPITQGDSVDFTAAIAGSPSVGTVSFYFDYGQPDQFQIGGAVNVNSGSATSDATTALPAGSDTITAIYSGGTGFAGSQGTDTLLVNQTTTTTVTSNPVGPITQGDSVDFTAAITGSPSVGTVSFYFDYGQPDQFQIGGAVNVVSGSATSDATTALPAGSDTITAIYSGGTGFAGSQGTVTIQVNSTAPPPTLTNVVINQDISALYNAAGQPFAGAQRSMVNDIVYTFSEPVNILDPGTDPNVFTVAVASGWTGTVPTLSWASVAGSGDTQWAVTFTGGSVTGGSIANGAYTITVTDPGSITAESDSQALTVTPGVAPGSGNPDYATQQFYRLFGDINGDEFVNASDNAKFKQALNTYNAAFDFSQDGFVNASDNVKFKNDLTVNFSGFAPTI
jgi:IPT/TIG domain/Bacterial Ig-like domain (group 3)/Dockerin type I domain